MIITRMARETNTAVVLHPLNSAVITLDLCICLDDPPSQLWRKNMVREEDEMASKTIERLRILLAQQKGEVKNNRRATREDILKNCPAIEVLGVTNDKHQMENDVPEVLTPLDMSVSNKIFWRCARQLLISSTVVKVKYNVPTITSVVPPSALYVGSPAICSGITTLFTSDVDVHYEWGSKGSTAAPNTTVHVLSTSEVFIPSKEQLGEALVLRVSPAAGSDTWTQVDLPPLLDAPPLNDRWKHTERSVEAPQIRIVTYNVLHDELCTTVDAKRRIYPFATDDVLALEYRQVRIVQELLAYNTDVICLQECGKKVYQHFFERTLRYYGYEGCYTNKNGGVREGCACFWRRSRFCVQQTHEFPLNWTTLERDHPVLAAEIKPHSEFREALENVTTVAVLVLLKDLHTERELLIGNTHLYYRAGACHIRLMQMYMLLHAIKLYSSPRHAVVLCGDFNFTHATGGYQLATTGRTEATHFSWDKGKFFFWGSDTTLGVAAGDDHDDKKKDSREAKKCLKGDEATESGVVEAAVMTSKVASATVTGGASVDETESAHDECRPLFKAFRKDLHAALQLSDAYGVTDPNMPWTNYTMTFREVIDYIFFSSEHLSVVRTVPIPMESELSECVALPNKRYPSDHLALIADLEYKSTETS